MRKPIVGLKNRNITYRQRYLPLPVIVNVLNKIKTINAILFNYFRLMYIL